MCMTNCGHGNLVTIVFLLDGLTVGSTLNEGSKVRASDLRYLYTPSRQ